MKKDITTYRPLGANIGYAVYDQHGVRINIIFNRKADYKLMDEICHSDEDVDAHIAILERFGREYNKRRNDRAAVKPFWRPA